MQLLGEGAALAASILWTFTSLAFTLASKRVGPLAVNLLRILFAIGLLALAHVIILGTLIPKANDAQWGYLSASGIIGLAIGDLGYFGSLVILRPRRATLLMAVNPIFSSILGYFALGEVLSLVAIAGIAVTLTGVLLVVLEKEEKTDEKDGKADEETDGVKRSKWLTSDKKWLGVLFGVIGSLGQGIGLVISKYGMQDAATAGAGTLNPLSTSLIRMLAAGLFFLILMVGIGRLGNAGRAFKDRQGMSAIVAGTIIGPFLGVWVSMLAVSNTDAGIAATLMSMMPVFIIPVVYVLYREKTSWRGILGAFVAIAGVAMLLLL